MSDTRQRTVNEVLAGLMRRVLSSDEFDFAWIDQYRPTAWPDDDDRPDEARLVLDGQLDLTPGELAAVRAVAAVSDLVTETPLDIVEAFIAREVGWHADAMREQARNLLDELTAHGYRIVHPDDVPERYDVDDTPVNYSHSEAMTFLSGWNACRDSIVGAGNG